MWCSLMSVYNTVHAYESLTSEKLKNCSKGNCSDTECSIVNMCIVVKENKEYSIYETSRAGKCAI